MYNQPVIGYLYSFTCNKTNLKYVGSTTNLQDRKRDHLRLLITESAEIIQNNDYVYWESEAFQFTNKGELLQFETEMIKDCWAGN